MKPKKRKPEPKGFVLQVRLTDELKVAFEAAARLDGNTLSAFARSAMTAKARQLGVQLPEKG
jgi:uncharacterized protein (DUF1778 family)